MSSEEPKVSLNSIWTVVVFLIGIAFYAGISWYMNGDAEKRGDSQWLRINKNEERVAQNKADIANIKDDIVDTNKFVLTYTNDTRQLSQTLYGLVEVMKAFNDRMEDDRQHRNREYEQAKEMSRDISAIKAEMASINARIPKS